MLKIILIIALFIILIMIFIMCRQKVRKLKITNEQPKDIELIKNAICPWCKTGKETQILDEGSIMCPYIGSLKDGKCPFFKRIG